jgi:hypothetical protein
VPITLAIAGLLVVSTIVIHYEALRLMSALVSEWPRPPRLRILLVVIGCFLAHFVEICLYALAFFLVEAAGLGALTGRLEGHAGDYLYLSAAAYSTVGFGDIYGTGALRLISALEAVNGLFLVAWSTSFTYLAMERLWPLHSRVRAGNERD